MYTRNCAFGCLLITDRPAIDVFIIVTLAPYNLSCRREYYKERTALNFHWVVYLTWWRVERLLTKLLVNTFRGIANDDDLPSHGQDSIETTQWFIGHISKSQKKIQSRVGGTQKATRLREAPEMARNSLSVTQWLIVSWWVSWSTINHTAMSLQHGIIRSDSDRPIRLCACYCKMGEEKCS